MKFKIGDNVKIKNGAELPDINIDISGWQGRISEVIEEYGDERIALINIKLDSLTLKQIPDEYIRESEEEGLGWDSLNMYISDIEFIDARDKVQDNREIIEIVSQKHQWSYLGEAGQRIADVLSGVNSENEWKCFLTWDKYLENKLQFPFKAKSEVVDMYGLIAKGKLNKKTIELPLCDLEVIDSKTVNNKFVDDYRTWFANR